VQEALPNFKDGLDSFNVTNYVKVTSTVDQVMILSYDENTTVTPQLIIPEQVIQAIATEIKQRGA
jgi:glutamate formiminotransferase